MQKASGWDFVVGADESAAVQLIDILVLRLDVGAVADDVAKVPQLKGKFTDLWTN